MNIFGLVQKLLGKEALPLIEEVASVARQLSEPHPTDVIGPDEYADAWWQPRARRAKAAGPARDPALEKALHDQLVRIIREPDVELPQVPKTAQRLLGLLRQPDEVALPQLAGIAHQDPALVAEVLRVANSVAYRGVKEVGTFEAAVARLGLRTLRRLLLSMALRSVADEAAATPTDPDGRELWRRALASGIIVAEVAKRLGSAAEVVDQAFLIGLLHDLGLLALLRIVREYQAAHGRRVPREVFERVAEEWHEHLGLRLATQWSLPDPLPDLIGKHHYPPGPHDPLGRWRALLQFADVVCGLTGYSPQRMPDGFWELACVQMLALKQDRATLDWLVTLPATVEEQFAGY